LSKGSTALAACIIALIILNVFSALLLIQLRDGYGSLEERYEAALEKVGGLSKELQSLKRKYSEIESEYRSLKDNYTRLDLRNRRLLENLSALEERVAAFEEDLSGLRESYELLASNYSSLNSSYHALKSDYEKISSLLEDLPKSVLLKPRNLPELIGSALAESPELWFVIEEAGLSKADAPALKAEKATLWILTNLEYLPDDFHEVVLNGSIISFPDHLDLPSQVLFRSGGDCEDLSLLAYALLSAVLGDSERVYLISLEGLSEYAHMAVLYKTGSGFIIVDPAGLYATDRHYAMKVVLRKLSSGGGSTELYLNPLKISPEIKSQLLDLGLADMMFSLGSRVEPKPLKEALGSWISMWSEELPGARVSFVANSTFYKTFNSTSEFVDFVESGGLG